MPNGFHGSKEQWERLEAPLPTIDNNLRSFAHSKNLDIDKNYHNWPSRSLEWENKGIKRKIQIYLENQNQKTYNLWLCAYRDKDNTRYWKNEFLKKNVLFSEISGNIEELLKKSFSTVESWTEKDLEKTN